MSENKIPSVGEAASLVLFASLGVPVLAFLQTIYSAWAWAIVAGNVWLWFLSPMLPHAIMPTLAQFVGVLLAVKVAVHSKPDRTGGKDTKAWQGLAITFAHPWFFLLGSWFLHLVYVPGVYAVAP